MPVWKNYYEFADYVEVEEEIKKDVLEFVNQLKAYGVHIED